MPAEWARPSKIIDAAGAQAERDDVLRARPSPIASRREPQGLALDRRHDDRIRCDLRARHAFEAFAARAVKRAQDCHPRSKYDVNGRFAWSRQASSVKSDSPVLDTISTGWPSWSCPRGVVPLAICTQHSTGYAGDWSVARTVARMRYMPKNGCMVNEFGRVGVDV